MARSINRLSARKVATEKKPGLHADGDNLYLQISTGGAKSWIFRFTGFKYNKDGSQKLDQHGAHARGLKDMGLGPLRDVSLLEARQEAERCRKLIRDGIDPIDHRIAEQSQRRVEAAKTHTFKECAEAYIKSHSDAWKNVKHASQWTNTLKTYVYPEFGDLPVQAIDTGLVMEVLEPIWRTKTETASRVRGRIESVLDWATALNYREGENPARWKGHLKNLLPERKDIQKVKHHAALPYDDAADFMSTLRSHDSISAHGLDFLILTAARTGEVIGARWDEINFAKKDWTIPADRMKTKKEHRVPLSLSAMTVLESLKGIAQNEFVFPGTKSGTHLSNMAFLQLLKRMGRADLTAHGFRSTFRDWAAERTAFPDFVVEKALAHAVADKVEAAYRRGDLFDKRRKLMDAWAGYCALESSDNAGTVVSIRQGQEGGKS